MSENKLPIEQLKVLPKVKEFVPNLQNDILEGNVNPLEINIFLKKVGKIAEEMVKGEKGSQIKELILDEIVKNQEGTSKTINVFGTQIRESNRKYYDYTNCNDIVWEELDKIEKQVKELKKKREEELKLTIPSQKENLDNLAQGLGIVPTNIAVSYVPKLILEPTNDLLEINPPTVGINTIHSYYL